MGKGSVRSPNNQPGLASPASQPLPEHVIGVDGCRAGWVACVVPVLSRGAGLERFGFDRATCRVLPTLAELVAAFPGALVAIDMPIGLMDRFEPGGRACDRQARAILGKGRSSSAFAAPVRAVLDAPDYPGALAANRLGAPPGTRAGISKQAFNIVPKIREVDKLLRPDTKLRDRIFETHPELAFTRLAGTPISEPKRTAEGQERRCSLLVGAGFEHAAALVRSLRVRGQVERDDLLDAMACAHVAARIVLGTAKQIGDAGARDGRGLPMQIAW